LELQGNNRAQPKISTDIWLIPRNPCQPAEINISPDDFRQGGTPSQNQRGRCDIPPSGRDVMPAAAPHRWYPPKTAVLRGKMATSGP
jgi:hypothetical protein